MYVANFHHLLTCRIRDVLLSLLGCHGDVILVNRDPMNKKPIGFIVDPNYCDVGEEDRLLINELVQLGFKFQEVSRFTLDVHNHVFELLSAGTSNANSSGTYVLLRSTHPSRF